MRAGHLKEKRDVSTAQGRVTSRKKHDVSKEQKHMSSQGKSVMFSKHKGTHVKGKNMIKSKVCLLSLGFPLYDKSLQLSRLSLETTCHHLIEPRLLREGSGSGERERRFSKISGTESVFYIIHKKYIF
jgi:hypothetical protein